VLLAGNVYLQGVAPALAARIMPVGTYIACSQTPATCAGHEPGAQPQRGVRQQLRARLLSPTPDHRMLYGGRVSYSTATPANLAESMRQRMQLTFPQLAGQAVEYAWGGFVDITMNRAPDFGRLPPHAPAGLPTCTTCKASRATVWR
jgi:gamma-glutamylputrescine oxidase